MLDITRNTSPTPAQLAKARMAAQKAGLSDDAAKILMANTDPDTAAEVAPEFARDLDMLASVIRTYLSGTEEVTKAALAEMEAILTHPDTTPDNLRAKALARHDALVRANVDQRTRRGADVGNSWDEGEGFRTKMIAALGKRLDPAAAERAGYKGDSATVADIAMSACRKVGLRPVNTAEAIRMATHSTTDFPLILDGTMSNLVGRRMEVIQPAIMRAAREVLRIDYRQGRSLTLSATTMPAEIRDGGEITFVTADEKGELLPAPRDFGAGLNITNQALVNDSTATGLLNDIGARMAEGAVERFRQVLLEPLLANAGAGQTMANSLAMFHATHGNLAAPGATITVLTLSTARTAMRRQRSARGGILGVEPWAIVVPPEMESTAQQVVADLQATAVADVNPFAGKLEVIVEDGLASATAWYLVADPARFDGLTYAFLEGQRSPRVESRPAWSTLGLEFRLTWAIDAKFVETATWYRNPGA